MFENTKLVPVYNGYQYLIVFISAIVLDLIIHFFSSRKYAALTAVPKTDAIGFAPELMFYYNSLRRKGPFHNSWLMGMLIAGTVAVFILLITDIILQLFSTYMT